MATAIRTTKVAPVISELDVVFRTYYASTLRAAFRVTGSLADAEDAAQSVFLGLARTELDTSRIQNMASYLRRAAVNAALDLLRSRILHEKIPIEQAVTLPSPTQLSPERAGSSSELRDQFRRAIAKLHPRAAEMFALRYFEGFDNREVARMMQTSQGVVAVTLHRARPRLQKELQSFSMKGK